MKFVFEINPSWVGCVDKMIYYSIHRNLFQFFFRPDSNLPLRNVHSENDHTTLQNDLKNLEKWASDWGMRFSAKKCYMKKKSHHSYTLNNQILEQVPSNPYLGLQVPSNPYLGLQVPSNSYLGLQVPSNPYLRTTNTIKPLPRTTSTIKPLP